MRHLGKVINRKKKGPRTSAGDSNIYYKVKEEKPARRPRRRAREGPERLEDGVTRARGGWRRRKGGEGC